MLVHVPSMAVCIRRAPEFRMMFCSQHTRLFYQHADRDSQGAGAVRRQCIAITMVPFFTSVLTVSLKLELKSAYDYRA